MLSLEQSIFLKTLAKQPVPRTPVWIMRQAGRYLPEYRAVREKAGSFMRLCQTPELACEVALQPLRRYALDAAIVFSDILTIPDAMGLELYFIEGEGPKFHRPLRQAADIDQLPKQHVLEKLAYVFDAVHLLRREMPAYLPLIGFAGSPWTLACYMVEGGSSRSFKQMITLLYEQPEIAHRLLDHLSHIIRDYLLQQVAAGANVLMLFDTWGGLLTRPQYLSFSLHYMSRIIADIKQLHPNIPMILFTKGGGQWLEPISQSGCDVVGVDWTVDLSAARKVCGDRVGLQGNLDPTVLCTNPDSIREEVKRVLDEFGHGSGHIFNLGHGITPDVPPEYVTVMLEAIAKFSPAYHQIM